MKKFLFLIILAFFTCHVFAQTQYEPWGVWNYDIVDEKAYILELESGKYYAAYGGGYWITISQNTKGFVAGNFNFPVLGIEGMFIKIEKIEQVKDGFIFYLIGVGFKREEEKKTQFKENTRITMKMIFISENECYFQYDSKVDEEGFHLGFSAKENIVHKRYKVK